MEPVSLVIAGSVAAAPVIAGLRRIWRWWKGAPDPTTSARYALGAASELIAALPPGWARWGGARPELRGAPRNSILDVRGLAEQAPIVRATLLDVAEQLGIPVDSLATVIAHESGWRADAKNPLGAFGLIQLTQGAHLPGFLEPGALALVPLMPAAEQLTQIALPYFARQKGARGADIGHLAMLNFLPKYAGHSEAFVLARAGENVYQANAALDLGKKGSITVGDVYESFAVHARRAGGRRVAVDGRIIEGQRGEEPAPKTTTRVAFAQPNSTPTKVLPPAAPEPAETPSPASQYTVGYTVPTPAPELFTASPDQLSSGGAASSLTTFASEITAGCACDEAPSAQDDVFRPQITAAGSSARGVLLAAVRAGAHRPVAKMELELPERDLVVTILRDALQAKVDGRWLRLGVSYNEQVEICRLLGMISPTQEIVTAAWEVARDAGHHIQPLGLVHSAADFALMDSMQFAIRHNDNIEAAIAAFGPDDFCRPYGKAWIVHPRQVEPDKDGVVRGVVEFGWQHPNGRPIQGPGSGGHDRNYMDYSMVTADLCDRRARRLSTGEAVDLVDEYRALFPGQEMAEVIGVYR